LTSADRRRSLDLSKPPGQWIIVSQLDPSITTINVKFEGEGFDHQLLEHGDFGVRQNCDNIRNGHKDKIDQN
jgi:hypothetical protein